MSHDAPERTHRRFLYVVLIGIAATIVGLGVPSLVSAAEPIVCDMPPLIAQSPQAGAQLGWSMAIQANGPWLAVGANLADADSGRKDSGGVALYLNPQPGARPNQEIPNSEIALPDLQANDQFGSAVAIDGNWLAVGAPGQAQNSGVVYLFHFDGTSWVQMEQKKLAATDAARGAQFGFSVSLSGMTLVVGAPGDSGRGSSAGAAYVFELGVGGWKQTKKLLTNDGRPFDKAGSAVATDGDEIVVGAPFADDLTVFKNTGAAYVFHRDSTAPEGWAQEAKGKLTAGPFVQGHINIQFGAAVGIRGERIVVGAPGDDDTHHNLTDSGSAYVFEREGLNWAQQPVLTAESPRQGAQFGTAVLIDDQNRVVIGARFDGEGSRSAGAAYLFEKQSNGSWLPQIHKFIRHSVGGAFGQSVAIFGDTVFMGGFQDDVGTAIKAGAVATCPSVVPPRCLTITKNHDQAAVCPGDPLTYEIAVINDQGLGPVNGAMVVDDFPPSTQLQVISWTCTPSDGASCTPSFGSQVLQGVVNLPMGEGVHYKVETKVQASGTITNRFRVIPPPGVVDPTCTLETEDPIDIQGDLGISVVGPSQVSAGDVATYSVVVTHSGAATTGVRVKVDVTGGTPLSPTDSRCFVNPQGGFTCNLGNFPAGSSSVPLELKVQAPVNCSCPTNPITLTANVTADERDCNVGNDTATASTAVACIADLVLVASTPAVPVTCGTSFPFSLTVSNLGPAVAKGAVVDVIATGAISLTSSEANCVPVAGPQPHLLCSGLPDLPPTGPGHSITFHFSAQAPACSCGAGCGAVTINATVQSGNTCGPNPPNNMVNPVIQVKCKADLAITKTHEPAVLAPGQPMAYVITVHNNGPSDSPGATVMDWLPKEMLGPHCVGANRLDCTFLVNNLNIAVGPLPVGGEASYRIEGQLTSQCITTPTLTNTATVSPLTGVVDCNPSNDSAMDTAPVPPTPGVSIECHSPSMAFEGDFVTFTYVLSNGGPNAQADNPGPEFTDTLPVGLTLVTATASSGTVTTAANTVSWNGSIPVCGTVTIAVQATVDVGTVNTTLCNQGDVFFDANGDGVNESNASAVCCVKIIPPCTNCSVPALEPAGLAALIILLACVALLRLRRARD